MKGNIASLLKEMSSSDIEGMKRKYAFSPANEGEWGDYSDTTRLTQKIQSAPKMRLHGTFCLWSDLLGFGEQFFSKNWQLREEDYRKVYDRLHEAHSVVLRYSSPMERMLLLNDGIAYSMSYDINETFSEVIGSLVYYLRNCVELHLHINGVERKNAYPGCRSVLSWGTGVEYLCEEVRFDDYVLNYTKPNPRGLSTIAEKNGNPTCVYSPKAFQMNSAFSKSYILESLGSKYGVSGPNLYIDKSVLLELWNMAKSVGIKPIYKHIDGKMIFLLPSKSNEIQHVYMGFMLEKPLITKVKGKWKTKIYKLLRYYPHDVELCEDDPFYFDLLCTAPQPGESRYRAWSIKNPSSLISNVMLFSRSCWSRLRRLC